MDLTENLVYKRRSVPVKSVVSDSDRKFLIDFIVTTYLGPDVVSHNPPCSVVQRVMAGSPPYVLSDLRPSYVSISLLEKLYYYLLRFSSPHLILDPNMFRMYLKGKLFLPSSDFTPESKQFTNFFPLHLHQQIWYPDSFRTVKSIVLIDDPSPACIKEEDFNRFRSLTGISVLKINLGHFFRLGCNSKNENGGDCLRKEPKTIPNGGFQSGKFQQEYKVKNIDEKLSMPEIPRVSRTKHNATVDPSKNRGKYDEPTFMPLLSIPNIDNCSQDSSVILSGTARKGLFGPSIGVMDIGASNVAYLFRVSLPGVKKDCSQFSCEIESNGRIQIRGVVSGGRIITKQSRVFHMKIRKLCSAGPFTLSFSLPGPVDPRLVAANFRSDGIFEGVIVKH